MNTLLSIYPSVLGFISGNDSALTFKVDEATFRSAEAYMIKRWPDFKILNAQLGKLEDVTKAMDRTTSSSYPYVLTSTISLLDAGGIILHINTLMETFGFYFACYTKKALVPIMHSSISDYNISYYPFNSKQAATAVSLEKLVRPAFPGYQKFDNSHASIQIQELQVAEDRASDIDFFQAIFSVNVLGLI